MKAGLSVTNWWLHPCDSVPLPIFAVAMQFEPCRGKWQEFWTLTVGLTVCGFQICFSLAWEDAR